MFFAYSINILTPMIMCLIEKDAEFETLSDAKGRFDIYLQITEVSSKLINITAIFIIRIQVQNLKIHKMKII